MGLLETLMGPRILNSHLTAKLTSNLNSLYRGANQKLNQIQSLSNSFLIKWLRPIPEISLWVGEYIFSGVSPYTIDSHYLQVLRTMILTCKYQWFATKGVKMKRNIKKIETVL